MQGAKTVSTKIPKPEGLNSAKGIELIGHLETFTDKWVEFLDGLPKEALGDQVFMGFLMRQKDFFNNATQALIFGKAKEGWPKALESGKKHYRDKAPKLSI